MPTYKKSPQTVKDMAKSILEQFESHHPIRDAGVRVDILMAYPEYDEETGEPLNDALKHQGQKALGICRIVNLKDRTKGLGDAEILLDGHWWDNTASEEQQRALLDHELHHLAVKKKGEEIQKDDLGRPKLRMRKHDYQFGWFTTIAERHGIHSQERIQARAMMEIAGQYYWPEIAQTEGSRITKLDVDELRKIPNLNRRVEIKPT